MTVWLDQRSGFPRPLPTARSAGPRTAIDVGVRLTVSVVARASGLRRVDYRDAMRTARDVHVDRHGVKMRHVYAPAMQAGGAAETEGAPVMALMVDRLTTEERPDRLLEDPAVRPYRPIMADGERPVPPLAQGAGPEYATSHRVRSRPFHESLHEREVTAVPHGERVTVRPPPLIVPSAPSPAVVGSVAACNQARSGRHDH